MNDPLLLESVRCTYGELSFLLRQIKVWDSNEGSSRYCQPQQHITAELMRRIVRYLTVQPVHPSDVQVLSSSSHEGRHSLSECLTANEETWWVSGPCTMPGGTGREWLHFSLPTKGQTLCRLTSVLLKIPPLPLGPLSVWEFQLEVPVTTATTGTTATTSTTEPTTTTLQQWTPLNDTPFVVANRTGWQRFELPRPADVQDVRMVCLSNQMAQFIGGNNTLQLRTAGLYDSVGFYSIRFE